MVRVIFAALVLTACNAARLPPGSDAAALRVASFNIQVFGQSKASKPELMSVLAEVVQAYDLVAVQEVKDVTETAAQALLEAVNAGGASYELLLSERSGREPDDQSFQEQYAFYVRSTTLEVLDRGALFDDSGHDLFQREPFVARFASRSGAFDFAVASIHTRPDSAVAEIGALSHVFDWAGARWPDEDDVFAVGDFNADCLYATPEELDALPLRGASYHWVVPDDADTNVAPGSQCAYDRLVLSAGASEHFTGAWGVDRRFTDSAVSDHWPVWLELDATPP